jgi:hypothetical protein
MLMTEQAAVGKGNEGTPSLGDVRFEGGELQTFDGTSWIPTVRMADSGRIEIFRFGQGAAKSEPAPDSNQAGTAGNDAAGQ